MSISHSAYLTANGFRADPFATTNAEQETERLPSFFVRAAWFDQLVGDPQHPQSMILFAPQGFGKTSHRLEVARIVSERRDHPALVVTLNDFGLLMQNGAEQVTLVEYVALIRRLALEALDSALVSNPQRQARLTRDETLYARYCALLQLFAPLRSIGKQATGPVELFVAAFTNEQRGPREWMYELAELAQQAGFASIYVLLDGVDELQETRRQPLTMLRLLTPLLDAPGFLQGCDVAFKFFLPTELEAPIKQLEIGRLDRIPHRSLEWSHAQLRDMLSQRLNSYSLVNPTSPIGRIEHFQDLCEAVSIDIDQQLVQAAHPSPRRLLDLARQIIERHCDIATSPDQPIAYATVEAVLGSLQNEQPLPASPAITSGVPKALDEPEPRLFLDLRGDIWIGPERLNVRLPKRLGQCLAYLWANRSRVVRYEELQEALYSGDLEERGDPRSSVDKLVRRLRDVLEPGKPSSRTYIDVHPGIGYVLRNYRDS